MSKYQSIKIVNDWRLKWNRDRLPNYTTGSTIYYDKLSFFLRKKGVVNYDFAMGAYLFEIKRLEALNLNSSPISDPKDGSFLYNTYIDNYNIDNIFEDKNLEAYVLLDQRKDYDSLQATIYGIDEWFSPAMQYWENLALNNSYPKSYQKTLSKKIQKHAINRYGSKLLPPNFNF